MSVVDFRGKKLQMITAYNSYHTTQFFNSAVSKQNNKLYWKNRRPPAALHGHVVEYVQHLSVSVSRVSDSSTNSSYSTTQLALRLFLSGDFFSKRTLKKNCCFAKGVTTSNHLHGHLLQWLPAVLDALPLVRSALDAPAMSQCSQ